MSGDQLAVLAEAPRPGIDSPRVDERRAREPSLTIGRVDTPGSGELPLPRAELLQRLRETRRWDVVVIGGGATGLGCAVDAASRGLSTLLLESRDFAAGTSSRSSKLIHGGLRYLAQGRIGLVHEALAERARLLANAPHLVHPLRFVVPAANFFQRLKLSVGVMAYHSLAGRHALGATSLLNARQAGSAVPNLNPAKGHSAVAYWDAQFDDARLAIDLMKTVFDHGGLAINAMPVVELLPAGGFGGAAADSSPQGDSLRLSQGDSLQSSQGDSLRSQKNGRIATLRARDALSGEVFEFDAGVIINAAGVWADRTRRLALPSAPAMLSVSRGIHLVVDAEFLGGDDALVVPETDDGRLLFVLPWHGKVLLGTTDTPCPAAEDEPQPSPAEIDYVLQTAAPYLKRAPQRSDIRAAFAGLRPLLRDLDRTSSAAAENTASLSREHQVREAPEGVISVVGGKWTTYRAMAEDAVDAALASAGLGQHRCVTSHLPIHRSTRTWPDQAPGRAELAALVDYAVRFEQAHSLDDVLARRSRLLLCDAAAAIELAAPVAEQLRQLNGQSAAWRDAELARFVALAQVYRGR
ncbi:MAG TPA: glycerol-3-phosphate dehydrogenase/oxidase [Rhodocyclaceae bacterium]|nr:glycerol-3-phosphate dehydrogenase/oxidase [Rhodocyclaceae bacterium]